MHEERKAVKEALEKQLQLLSERSEKDEFNLATLTEAMCDVALILLASFG